MYEGQTLICQNIIEENWLEFLAYMKKQTLDEEERQKKRMEKLAEIEGPEMHTALGAVNIAAEKTALSPSSRHYYDININSFWNWYIETKIQA